MEKAENQIESREKSIEKLVELISEATSQFSPDAAAAGCGCNLDHDYNLNEDESVNQKLRGEFGLNLSKLSTVPGKCSSAPIEDLVREFCYKNNLPSFNVWKKKDGTIVLWNISYDPLFAKELADRLQTKTGNKINIDID